MVKKLWNKNFALLLQASAISTIGDIMYGVAIGYWVFAQTGSSTLMGIMSAISMFVTMFLSPFSGSIIDKCNRKWVIVIGDLFQGAIMLTVGVFAYMDKLSVPGVLVAAFLAALGGVFYSPAANTTLIDIIPKDDIVRGQSLFSGVSSTISLVGTTFSGVVVAFFGVPLIIVLNGLSNIYSAISELFITVPKTAQQGEAVNIKSILSDTKAAIVEIFTDAHLKIFVPCLLIINLLAAGAFTLMLPFTMEKGFSVEQYGYFLSVWSIASLASVIILGIVKFNSKTRFWIMAIAFPLSEVFLIFAFLSSNFIAMALLAFVGGFLNAAGNAIFSASLMLALPQKNRGSILGFISSASVGGSALSSLIYGVLGDIFPLYIVFVIGATISLVPMLYLCAHPKTKAFIVSN